MYRSMHEQPYRSGLSTQSASGDGASGGLTGRNRWYDWAGRHPGVVLLGGIILAVLAIPAPPRICDVERDQAGEEVPLFI